MEIEPEDVPNQIKHVLGMLADCGALSGKDIAMGTTIKEAFARQRRRGSSKDDVHAMPARAETRERPEHLRPLLVDGPGRHDATDHSSQRPMETTPTESPSLSIPPAVLDVTSDADIDPKGHQCDGVQEGGPLMAVESSKQDCAAGFFVAFSQMGPQQEDPGVGRERGQHSHEESGADLGADLQVTGETRGHSQLPCTAKQDEASASHSLEIGAGHERSQAALTFDDSGEL